MDLGLSYIGVFLGAGLCLIGGAYGISKLASAALEKNVNAAMKKIERLPTVVGRVTRIRLEELL